MINQIDNLKNVISDIALRYCVLDMNSILRMMTKEKPRFALFDIKEEKLLFRFTFDNFFRYPKFYPYPIVKFYRDSVFSKIGSDNIWECVFRGILPKYILQLIDKEKDNFDHICLLQEVEKWETRLEQINPGDPLLIGVKNGVYYLLAKFDTTTQEEYMAREFALTSV